MSNAIGGGLSVLVVFSGAGRIDVVVGSPPYIHNWEN